MKMELGEHPRQFLLRVDRMVKELERVEGPVDPKDVDIVILSGLTSQYDAEIRMLEGSLAWPTREWIERACQPVRAFGVREIGSLCEGADDGKWSELSLGY